MTNLKINRIILGTCLILAGGFASLKCYAGPQEDLTTAQELYTHRAEGTDLAHNPKIDQAIQILDGAIGNAATDADTAFKSKILKSRCLYWKGGHTAVDADKLPIYEEAEKAAVSAQDGGSSDYSEGFYYFGLSLARWAEAKGVMASLSKKGELIKSMEDTIAKITIDSQNGETIDAYGPDRILGRIYYKLPGFAGGSRTKALDFLGKAYHGDNRNFLNGIYYAETLIDGGNASEKQMACSILNDVLTGKIAGYAERTPENTEDIVIAKKDQSQFCH